MTQSHIQSSVDNSSIVNTLFIGTTPFNTLVVYSTSTYHVIIIHFCIEQQVQANGKDHGPDNHQAHGMHSEYILLSM